MSFMQPLLSHRVSEILVRGSAYSDVVSWLLKYILALDASDFIDIARATLDHCPRFLHLQVRPILNTFRKVHCRYLYFP